jgi:HEAT repeat protein
MIAAVLPLALVLIGPPPGAGDELLQEVAAYRYGQSREALFRLRERVRASLANPSDRQEMERQLVELVESDATVEAREFACRELRLIGTASAVPALARLLDDTRRGEAALFALASIPAAEATDALSATLEASSGRLQVALIHALAQRGIAHPAFDRLAGEEDPEVAAAATWALGQTGNIDDARRILSAHPASLEGREAALRIAERSGDAGEPVFRQLLAPREPAVVRVAALQGIVRLGGAAALPDLAATLRSDAAPLQAEAIRLAAFGDGVDLLIEATPDLQPPARRRALIALGEARVSRALPLMLASLNAADEGERTAALAGVGALGGPAQVPLLAERAATATGPEQEAARAALAGLRGPGVDEALVAAIPPAVGGTKRELVRAAGRRNAATATDTLLEATASSRADVRIAALRALRQIAPTKAVPPMAALLLDAGTLAERREAERTLAAILKRHPDTPLDPAVGAFESATTVEARVSIVSAVGQSGRDEGLPFLRQALASEEADLRRAAVLALTEWPTPAPAPDLLAVARGETEGSVPVLALRGYVRLVSAPSALLAEEVTARLAPALDVAGPEERKAVLAALQKHACAESLTLARTLLEDPEVAAEARLAVEKIEDSLSHQR